MKPISTTVHVHDLNAFKQQQDRRIVTAAKRAIMAELGESVVYSISRKPLAVSFAKKSGDNIDLLAVVRFRRQPRPNVPPGPDAAVSPS